ncbi:hypothetical protein SRHO_G00128150 [Serrasalmus rhombeus]
MAPGGQMGPLRAARSSGVAQTGKRPIHTSSRCFQPRSRRNQAMLSSLPSFSSFLLESLEASLFCSASRQSNPA